MFYEMLMEKQAKSRLVKEVEKLFSAGKDADAMAMLRRAEQGMGEGSVAAREIKGLKRRQYGSGMMGSVEDVFYGGQLQPAKRVDFEGRADNYRNRFWGTRTELAEELEQEYRTTKRVNELIRDNPEIARRIDAVKAKGMVGRSYNLSDQEKTRFEDLLAAAASKRGIAKKDKNKFQELLRRQRGKKAGQGRRMVMSRLPEQFKAKHTGDIDVLGGPDAAAQDIARRIEDAEEGIRGLQKLDPDLSFQDNIPLEGHNIVMNPGQKPVLYDFGVANLKKNPIMRRIMGSDINDGVGYARMRETPTTMQVDMARSDLRRALQSQYERVPPRPSKA